MLVGMELGDVVSFIFLPRVPQHLQLGLIYAEYRSVSSDPVQANCRVLEKVIQLSFASQERPFCLLTLGDVSLDADVANRLS